MIIRKVDCKSLRPNPKNPRVKLERGMKEYEDLRNLIERFDYVDPIIWNERTGYIVSGHQRLQVMKDIAEDEGRELDEVSVVVVDYDEKKQNALMIAINKIDGIWDYEMLSQIMDGIDEDVRGLTGFTEEELGLYDCDFDDDGDVDYDSEDEGTSKDEKEEDETYVFYSEEEIQSDFEEALKVRYERIEGLVENAICKAGAMCEFNRLCDGGKAGYYISLLFNPHRLDVETAKSKSTLFRVYGTDRYANLMSKYLMAVEDEVLVEWRVIDFTRIGTVNTQSVGEFPPYIARDLYRSYVKDGYTVLDPCSGWGGRTLGLASSGFKDITYITTDPSVKTYQGLLRLKEFLGLGDNYQYHNLPFEDLDVEEESIDFCFTSPPYFDTERYSDDEGQSFKRNGTYEDWKRNFLWVLLDKVYKGLKHGRFAVLNVGVKKYPIADDIKEWLIERDIPFRNLKDYHIGGFGLGERTNKEDVVGEPFIEFYKK